MAVWFHPHNSPGILLSPVYREGKTQRTGMHLALGFSIHGCQYLSCQPSSLAPEPWLFTLGCASATTRIWWRQNLNACPRPLFPVHRGSCGNVAPGPTGLGYGPLLAFFKKLSDDIVADGLPTPLWVMAFCTTATFYCYLTTKIHSFLTAKTHHPLPYKPLPYLFLSVPCSHNLTYSMAASLGQWPFTKN